MREHVGFRVAAIEAPSHLRRHGAEDGAVVGGVCPMPATSPTRSPTGSRVMLLDAGGEASSW